MHNLKVWSDALIAIIEKSTTFSIANFFQFSTIFITFPLINKNNLPKFDPSL
jgi:hypothetical protein